MKTTDSRFINRLLLSALVALTASAATAEANQFIIANPGFEDLRGPTNTTQFDESGQLRDACFSGPACFATTDTNAYATPDPIPGWTIVSGNCTSMGTYNPRATDFSPEATEGRNTAYLDVHFNGDFVTISQNLCAVLTPGIYTLQVDAGHRNDIQLPSYGIQLLAGGAVIAEDTRIPPLGGWVTVTASATVSPTNANLGLPLAIRLYALGISPKNGQIDFDNVRLDGPPGICMSIGTAVEIRCTALVTNQYQVQWSTTLNDPNSWTNLGGPVQGTGSPQSIFDSTHGQQSKFYRVLLLP